MIFPWENKKKVVYEKQCKEISINTEEWIRWESGQLISLEYRGRKITQIILSDSCICNRHKGTQSQEIRALMSLSFKSSLHLFTTTGCLKKVEGLCAALIAWSYLLYYFQITNTVIKVKLKLPKCNFYMHKILLIFPLSLTYLMKNNFVLRKQLILLNPLK